MAKSTHKSWAKESRGNWGTKTALKFEDTADLLEKLTLGCMQRIASALELIARKMPNPETKQEAKKEE